MQRCSNFLVLPLVLSPMIGLAKEVPSGEAPDGLKHMKEASRYWQASGCRRCLYRPWHSKLHYRIADRRFPLRALVRWNSRKQKARHGASGQD